MLYQNYNDETLVMLTLAGEERAYEVLVARWEKSVVSSSLSITRNYFMSEDAAQDAFVTAWMKLDTLKEPKKFGAWVCRIAKNCAKNMLSRYSSILPLETVENLDIAEAEGESPEELYISSEQNAELYTSIGKLPEKVKRIIRLHYFEGLSVADIADKMRISEGTVKWQLHDGRKRLRKELCAMNEKYNDTLVERVMKKVEELKLWQFKNNKSGFEVIYNDVLRDIDGLPESADKYHALADVLMRGWWWLSGEKNDALFARIKEAAELGKNDDVMQFIVAREDMRLSGKARIEFIREKQIPRLEKAGFTRTLAREWFWLGFEYFRDGQKENGHCAYDEVERVAAESDPYRTIIPYAREFEERMESSYKDKNMHKFRLSFRAEEYRYYNSMLRFWNSTGAQRGEIAAYDDRMSYIFRNSSLCDGQFFVDGMSVGDVYTATDGTTLTFASDNESVTTPAGEFEGCRLFVVRQKAENGISVYKSYYKAGVGIVRHEHKKDGITDSRVLCRYNIVGGEGLLPIAVGNAWEYTDEYAKNTLNTEQRYEVRYADEKSAVIASISSVERVAYDESSWLDAIQEIRNDYLKNEGKGTEANDVYSAIERAGRLAKTPIEKAHARASGSVAKRILDTNPDFNPNHTATGHWNFFAKNIVTFKNGIATIGHDFRWSFEWKCMGGMEGAEDPLLYNDIYGILQDAANCLWSDEWRVGADTLVEYNLWGSKYIKTSITCDATDSITTKAGRFDNCIKLTLDISGMNGGITYRGGKKVYYFADGIGIVRTENEYAGCRTAVYELSAYEKTGKGYMPFEDGMMRFYEALDLTDGFVASTEYTYFEDEDGQIVIFADRLGIRQIPAPITHYSAIYGEQEEEKLWNSGEWQKAHLQYSVNSLNIMLHYLARPSRNRNNAKRSIDINGLNMNIIEGFGDNGEIPSAWLGLYAWTALIRAAGFFGNGDKEEGYASLETSLCYYEKWSNYKKGECLELGNSGSFGGIKYVKGEGCALLPDGRKEIIAYEYRMNAHLGQLLYALTAKSGWEWFNSVRSEERFKEYIEKAKALSEKE